MNSASLRGSGLSWIVVLILAMLSGAAWGVPGAESVESGATRERVAIGNSPTDYSLLLFIAQDRGFFAQNGLDAAIHEYPFGFLTLDHLAKGEIDFGLAADFAFVGKSFETGDLRILASICKAGAEELVARKDKGIATPGDLKGKRIGVTRKTATEYSLMKFLVFNGLSTRDVTIVDLLPADLVEGLCSGALDAFASWDVWVVDARSRLGDKVVSWPTRMGQEDYWLVSTRKELTDSRPETVKRVLKALLQAEDFATEHSDEARSILAKHSRGGPPAVKYSWDNNKYVVTLDQGLLEVLEDEADWKIKSSGTEKLTPPNYLHLIWPHGLDALRPKADTIFR